MKSSDPSPEPSPGWFVAVRYAEAPQLASMSWAAFVVLYIIAYRARWNPEALNPHGLELGEAIVDYKSWGIPRQQFRTAVRLLERIGLATFKLTNQFTVGKLTNGKVFDFFPAKGNPRSTNRQPTCNQGVTQTQPGANQRPTTN
jgi:hypothetical protein